MLNTARNMLSDAWGCWSIRLAVLAISLGYVPFYFLTCAAEALNR
ncbi:hypothetical protein LCGC14_1337200 [marine sediment metagenome]|uniref:Uncharacterized protein n=1 Tax=marine sediment metagenome TaxID=412755 RepID=A0A0F9NH09_9ZZZZ